MQDQLFPAGPVRVVASRPNRTRTNYANVRARLVDAGGVKRDPTTGRYWELHGWNKLRAAIPRTCRLCGETYRTSNWTERRRTERARGTCRNCSDKTQPIGTRTTETNGYIKIKTEAGWQLEHRWVMAQRLGRLLDADESVHHINGDRSDNRDENLQLRRRYHGKGQALCCGDCGSSNVVHAELS